MMGRRPEGFSITPEMCARLALRFIGDDIDEEECNEWLDTGSRSGPLRIYGPLSGLQKTTWIPRKKKLTPDGKKLYDEGGPPKGGCVQPY